ncbi:helix-turn-helix domain-containing protein [Anaerotruncus colihominis]|uniref:helix-turn-helix domain-containing protein n=1 Tax=Anaerotruncus colihominis TaxID=169435 RepID=UPI00267172C1|nr:helix-turn-helix transcriptional regulator [Anaerotruncus colihominis]
MTVGENIKRLRKERGLTQKQLGEKCGINEANLRKYEADKQNPKIETIERIAQALGVRLREIKENITWDEYQDTDESKQLERSTLPFSGMEVSLEKLFGHIEEKYVMVESGWQRPYWVVGNAPNTFVLHESDIEALVKSTESLLPALVDRLKDTRPEVEIVQEITSELNQLPPPEE